MESIAIYNQKGGTGKTTTIAKIGNYFAKRGQKVALVGLDTHRPAAPEQLKQLAEEHKISYFVDLTEKNPLRVVYRLLKRIFSNPKLWITSRMTLMLLIILFTQ